MKQGAYLSYIAYFLFFLLLQVLFLREVILFKYASCFAYVGFLLLLPMEMDRMLAMLLAFVLGVMVDSFYYTGGIHAMSSVALAYGRQRVLALLTPSGGYDATQEISIQNFGLQWFINYTGILVLGHHVLLFVIESWSIAYLWDALLKAFISTIFTMIMLVMVQYLFHARRSSV